MSQPEPTTSPTESHSRWLAAARALGMIALTILAFVLWTAKAEAGF
ncbi:MAG: hypothetical protein AB7Q00_08135 [Phycisphaerales bacterium]|nr:MAG: hypothetical protein IPK69_03175 [Phycisphaerales bacterium]